VLAYLHVHSIIFLSMVMHMHAHLMYIFGNWLTEVETGCPCMKSMLNIEMNFISNYNLDFGISFD